MNEADEAVSTVSDGLAEAGRAVEAFASGPAQAAGEALEQAFLKATRTIESELSRVVRTGEADLERLARMIVDTLVKLTADSALGGGRSEAPAPGRAGPAASSLNQIAAAVARAARRGARFT